MLIRHYLSPFLLLLPLNSWAIPELSALPPVTENPDNRYTEARMILGRALFFDNRISASGTMNCASCHLPHQGWTTHTALSPANPGWVERRNSPTLLNVGHNKALIWDGRAWPLEKQAIGSTKNPLHKGQNIDKLMATFNADPDMVKMFKTAYDSKPNVADYGKALAVFQRHFIVTGDSPFDLYMKGDKTALNETALRGMDLFKGKAGCIDCHHGGNFTDSDFHNVGLKKTAILDSEAHQKALKFDTKRTGIKEWETTTTDLGRYLISKDVADTAKFKTPTLRNLADTYPYMHDGRYQTLEQVIEHFNRGGDQIPNQDPRIKPLDLTEAEKQDLLVFLQSLQGALPDIKMEDWVRQVDGSDSVDGEILFKTKGTCVNCHQLDGKGIEGVFPPLAANKHVTAGNGDYVAKTILRGRHGKLEVNGQTFMATMPPIGIQQNLSDAEVAAIASYIRQAWGNQADKVTSEQVKAQR
ncbi:cytochrome c peroxidase [Candidatus Albibeggiatoa sp. nov. BB20]|uniref:cytochrome c peroxidase n=1 Tax=Candidatus Albibeggiatoa sp. nov. BB20 TaxID=3162723 RepID=UPI0033657969